MKTHCKRRSRFLLTVALLTLSSKGFSSPDDSSNNDEYNDSQTDNEQQRDVAWYSDWDSNRSFSIDLDTMTLRNTTTGLNDGPYGLELSRDNNHLWVMTRRSHFLDEIDAETDEIVDSVYLGHEPRMSAANPSRTHVVISGRQIPTHSVIRMHEDGRNEVVQQFNLDLEPQTVEGFGGQNATGHPAFLTEDIYIVSDRVNRELRVYSIEKARLLQTIRTNSPMHHMQRQGNMIFWAMEGTTRVRPSVLRLHFRPASKKPLRKIDYTYLKPDPESRYTDNWIKKKDQGLHHINFHPDGRHIYAGSAEGVMYVLDSWTSQVVDRFDVGVGAGHIDFAPSRGLAVYTAHKDSVITTVDARDATYNTVIEHVSIAQHREGEVMQGHTQGISDNESTFYGGATADGVFFEVDLEDFWNPMLGRTVDLDGADLRQGFMFLSPEGKFAQDPYR